jgi:hypothetical protein
MGYTSMDAIIKEELERFPGEALAEVLRNSACLCHFGDFPDATSSDFGDAAARCGLHRQGAMNRWRETQTIWGEDW